MMPNLPHETHPTHANLLARIKELEAQHEKDCDTMAKQAMMLYRAEEMVRVTNEIRKELDREIESLRKDLKAAFYSPLIKQDKPVVQPV